MLKESDLYIGKNYNYGFFKNLKLIRFDDEYVFLKDSNGNERKTQKILFLKYAFESMDALPLYDIDVSGLKFYVIRSKAGTFYERGKYWTTDINKAKTYNKIGSARIMLSHFLSDPNNIPNLVELSIGSYKIIDETQRINKNKEKKELRRKKQQMKYLERLEQAGRKYERQKGI